MLFLITFVSGIALADGLKLLVGLAVATLLGLYFRPKLSLRDLFFLVFMLAGSFAFTRKFSIALIYPVIARRIFLMPEFVRAGDLICTGLLIALTFVAKVFGALDNTLYMDRNYLGLVAFTYIVLLFKSNRPRSAVLFIILTLLLFSRVFIVSITIYGLACALPIAKSWAPRLRLRHWIAILLLTFIVSLGFISTADFDDYSKKSAPDSSRLTDLKDGSNLARMKAILIYLDYSTNSTRHFLAPTDSEEFFDLYPGANTPHNTLLQMHFNLGFILLVIYLIYIAGWTRLRPSLFPVLAGLVPYLTLLGGVLYGPTLMLVALAIRREKQISTQIFQLEC